MSNNRTRREQLSALYDAVASQPAFVATVAMLAVVAAVFEGVGLSFIIPVVELASDSAQQGGGSRLLGIFVQIYDTLGITFTLGNVIAGILLVMLLRYTFSFLFSWMNAIAGVRYEKAIKQEVFEKLLQTDVEVFDDHSSDEVINVLVTQANFAQGILTGVVKLFKEVTMVMMYLAIAVYLSPLLAVGAVAILGIITYVLRVAIEPGYGVGSRMAEANEAVQSLTQESIQGLHDVKLYQMQERLTEQFREIIGQYADVRVAIIRNQRAINQFYQLLTATTVFVLIYAALRFTSMSLSELGVFLFAMFRLAPKMSSINDTVYRLEGDLPHLIRTKEFIKELEAEPEGGRQVGSVENVAFDDVTFSYDEEEETTLRNISFDASRGEYIALVGPSGAGKSTVISLLSRMYPPDQGQVRLNDDPIEEFDLESWRSRLSVVRQEPYIFDETLEFNIKLGSEESDISVEEACEVARVSEFLDSLENGLQTELGEEGKNLSGGQQQRVALARAVYKRPDVLVLDEPTSNLDRNIEADIQRNVESLDWNPIVIVVAHRLSTVERADQILVLEDGEIVDTGTHSELIVNGGTYEELYETAR